MSEREISYFDLDDILAIHREVMERTGFSPAPLRSPESLEGALMRREIAATMKEPISLPRAAP